MGLLDEVLAANAAHLAGEPVPRPVSLGDHRLIVLTCMDPRLTGLLPTATGVAPDEMVMIRTAGASVTGEEGDPARSIGAALTLGFGVCVFVIGHTDCAMAHATSSTLLDGMKQAGFDAGACRGDVRGLFGAIASERANVIEAARTLRQSPLLPPGVPVHALVIDTGSGKLEVLERAESAPSSSRSAVGPAPLARSMGGMSRASGPVKLARLESSRIEKAPDLVPLELEPPPEKPPPEEPPAPPPPPPILEPVAPRKRKAPSPFERAEDVLKRLRSKRGRKR